MNFFKPCHFHFDITCQCCLSDTAIRIFTAFLLVLGGNVHVASAVFNYDENHNRLPYWLSTSALPLCLCLFPLCIIKKMQGEDSRKGQGINVQCLQLVFTCLLVATGLPVTAAIVGRVGVVLWLIPFLMSLTYVLHPTTVYGWCTFWISACLVVALGLPVTLWRAQLASFLACCLATVAMLLEILAVSIVAFDLRALCCGSDGGGWDLVEDEIL